MPTIDKSQFSTLNHNNWVGYIHNDYRTLIQSIPDNWPNAFLNNDSQISEENREGNYVHHITLGHQTCFLKHFTQLKAGNNANSRLQQLRWRFGKSRALQNFNANLLLQQNGFNTATVILAARNTSSTQTQDLFIAEEIRGQSLHRATLNASPEQFNQLLTNLGQTIAQFHRAGFIHGDLLPGNIILQQNSNKLFFIDNDRTRRFTWPAFAPNQYKNIKQLLYRLRAYFPYKSLKPFIDTYYDQMQFTRSQKRKQLAKCMRANRQRWDQTVKRIHSINDIPEEYRPQPHRYWYFHLNPNQSPPTN